MKQFVEQLRPRIRLDDPLQKINTFILEQNLPKEVFGGLPYEKNDSNGLLQRAQIKAQRIQERGSTGISPKPITL